MNAGDILVDDYLKYRHLWEEACGIFVHHTSAAPSIAALRHPGILEDRSEEGSLSELPPKFNRTFPRRGALLSSVVPGIEPFYACPIGTTLWEEFCAVHPEAPERPPCMQELCHDPDAAWLFDHASTCGHWLADSPL